MRILPAVSPLTFHELADRWRDADPAERANFQSYVKELCEALGVEPPRPAGSGYQFEQTIKVVARDGTESAGFVDCFKQGCFALEGKDEEAGRSSDALMRRAFGQVRNYASFVPGGFPPYIMVMDLARTLLIWDRWNGDYGGFNAARRVDLTRLTANTDDVELLKSLRNRALANVEDALFCGFAAGERNNQHRSILANRPALAEDRVRCKRLCERDSFSMG